MLTNGLLVGFAPAIERNCRHGPTPNAARQRQSRQHRGCSCIPLHTRTSRLGLSRFRNDRLLSSTIRKERSHENVTSNRARSSSADFRRNCEPKSGYGFGADFGADLVHKRLPTAAKSGANRPTSRSVSRDRDVPAGLSLGRPAGRPEQSSHRKDREIRNAENFWTHRIDDDSWVMGVLEPILLLLFIAVIAALWSRVRFGSLADQERE